jgi:hypothetical protein
VLALLAMPILRRETVLRLSTESWELHFFIAGIAGIAGS